MRILLDTHILLWAQIEPARLPKAIRADLEDPRNAVLFSAASIWEIAIKAQLGRGDFTFKPEEILQAAQTSGMIELPVTSAAAALVAQLPPHHRDPFDRLLVAQALAEPAHLFTADSALAPYSDLVKVIA